ncbi:MAG: ribonuclease III [Candidatus Microgenomates bacterium]|jgi:ribonuclease-3
MNNINNLKNIFNNKDLLTQALTHKSWVNEHVGERNSNERLEFLGDAVLEFIISQELYREFPDKPEGYLTSLRANLVNTENLANLAKKLNLGTYLYLAKGEEETGGRTNPSLLADTVEAIIGALFLDQGINPAYTFIKENLVSEIPEKMAKPLKDPKSRLQEYAQAKGLSTPKYRVLEELGPDHDKKFTVEVFVHNQVWGKGTGKSKNSAEQEAAASALTSLVI